MDERPDVIATQLRELLGEAQLRPPDVDAISVLITAGEWELALETLCTQIHEFEAPIASAGRERIHALGKTLSVDTRRLIGERQRDL